MTRRLNSLDFSYGRGSYVYIMYRDSFWKAIIIQWDTWQIVSLNYVNVWFSIKMGPITIILDQSTKSLKGYLLDKSTWRQIFYNQHTFSRSTFWIISPTNNSTGCNWRQTPEYMHCYTFSHPMQQNILGFLDFFY